MVKRIAILVCVMALLALAVPASAQQSSTGDCANLLTALDAQLAALQTTLGAGNLAAAITQVASLRQQIAACQGTAAVSPNATAEATAEPGKPGGGAVVTQAEPCTVSTTRTDVAMRVGPGTNRGVRSAFPANTAIPVVGQAAAADGSLWWKLQPPNVTTELDRYWVAQADVRTQGSCDRVAQSEASAIIAIVTPPPAGSSGGGSSSVTIANRSGITICYIFISPVTSTVWGNDWLGSSVLSSGASRSFSFTAGFYDVLLTDCSGATLLDRRGLDFTQPSTLSYP